MAARKGGHSISGQHQAYLVIHRLLSVVGRLTSIPNFDETPEIVVVQWQLAADRSYTDNGSCIDLFKSDENCFWRYRFLTFATRTASTSFLSYDCCQ